MLSRQQWMPRRPIRHAIKLDCQVVRERDFKLIAEQTLNVSERGLLVLPNEPVMTGEDVIVSFQAPYSRQYIDAVGTVARIVHGRRRVDSSFAFGISFHQIDDVAQALLRQNLRHVPPPLPQRRARPRLS